MGTTITVEGMNCEHCEQTVEQALLSVTGVTAASVDRADGQARIDGDAKPQVLVNAVKDAGYTAHV